MSWTRYVAGHRGVMVTVAVAVAVLVVGWMVTRESGDEQVGAVQPEILEFVTPEYPEEARGRGLEGTVTVKVLVGVEGEVLETEVMQGVDPLLDEAALEAARQSRWEPGRQRGIPVKAWMMLPFRFELK